MSGLDRAIKLRAWCISLNKMIDYRPVNFEEDGLFEWDDVNKEKDLIFLRFTGLLDKNGKEIYEGYILESNNYNGNHQFLVEFETDYMGAFGAFTCRCIDDENISSVHSQVIREGEIIGNIYENSELLNSKD